MVIWPDRHVYNFLSRKLILLVDAGTPVCGLNSNGVFVIAGHTPNTLDYASSCADSKFRCRIVPILVLYSLNAIGNLTKYSYVLIRSLNLQRYQICIL